MKVTCPSCTSYYSVKYPGEYAIQAAQDLKEIALNFMGTVDELLSEEAKETMAYQGACALLNHAIKEFCTQVQK